MSVPRIEGFEIIEKIGEGGMAVVWKARQISLDRIVAIKILSSQMRGDVSEAERFQAEARSAAKLKHPGIVQVHDAGTEQGHCYFVMEYVAGYTIGDWIRRKGRLSEDEALVVAECIGDSLNYAWTTAGIVHCDIKPDNIIIDDDGTVKVADLGLARTINAIGHEGMADEVMGTPAYISPEQAQGKPDLDCRSDIYSLGATMYHMLTGKMMFQGRPDNEIMELQVTTNPIDPKVLNPALSIETCRLLSAMLSKDPSLRPQSWTSVVEELVKVRQALTPRRSKARSGGRQPAGGKGDSDRVSRLAAAGSGVVKPTVGVPPAVVISALVAAVVIIGLVIHFNSSKPSPPGAGQRPALTPVVQGSGSPSGTDARSGLPGGAPGSAESAGSATSISGTRRPSGDPAEEMLEFAREWARENPGQIREAIQRFARVVDDTRGTKFALMAEGEIERLESALRGNVSKVMGEIAKRVKPLVESGDMVGAARIYEEYRGPFSAETKHERAMAAESLRKRNRRIRVEDAVAKRRSGARIKGALNELAEKLLTDGVDTALALAVDLAADPILAPDRDELQKIVQVIRKASSMDRRILDSFRAQKGVEVTLDFVQGKRTLFIVDVRGDRVVGRQMLATGAGFASSETLFGPADLSLREQMSRMGSDTEPDVALLKGLMAFRANSYGHARKYFGLVGRPLSDELLLCLDQYGDE